MDTVPSLDLHFLGRAIQEHRVVGLLYRRTTMIGEPYKLITAPATDVLSLLFRPRLVENEPVASSWSLLDFAGISAVELRAATFEPSEIPAIYRQG